MYQQNRESSSMAYWWQKQSHETKEHGVSHKMFLALTPVKLFDLAATKKMHFGLYLLKNNVVLPLLSSGEQY